MNQAILIWCWAVADGPPPFPFEQCDRAHGPLPKANVTILSVAHFYIHSTLHIHGTSLTHSPITRLPTALTVRPQCLSSPDLERLSVWLAG